MGSYYCTQCSKTPYSATLLCMCCSTYTAEPAHDMLVGSRKRLCSSHRVNNTHTHGQQKERDTEPQTYIERENTNDCCETRICPYIVRCDGSKQVVYFVIMCGFSDRLSTRNATRAKANHDGTIITNHQRRTTELKVLTVEK